MIIISLESFINGSFQEYETDEQGNTVHVRSERCEERSYVRFTNITGRPIDIYWVNYSGKPERYKRLKSGQFLDINTYTTHPWIFKDAYTQERFVVNNKKVFRGNPNAPRFPHSASLRSQPHFNIIRVNWNITAPLRDLRSNAMLAILNRLHDENAVKHLGLPASLEEELTSALVMRLNESIPEDCNDVQ